MLQGQLQNLTGPVLGREAVQLPTGKDSCVAGSAKGDETHPPPHPTRALHPGRDPWGSVGTDILADMFKEHVHTRAVGAEK